MAQRGIDSGVVGRDCGLVGVVTFWPMMVVVLGIK